MEFASALADVVKLSAVTSNTRLVACRAELGATTTCLFAAYMDLSLKEACAISGESYYKTSALARRTGLPCTRKALTNTYQALMLATMFDNDAAGLFTAFTSLLNSLRVWMK